MTANKPSTTWPSRAAGHDNNLSRPAAMYRLPQCPTQPAVQFCFEITGGGALPTDWPHTTQPNKSDCAIARLCRTVIND
jgi:hypothetical protein